MLSIEGHIRTIFNTFLNNFYHTFFGNAIGISEHSGTGQYLYIQLHKIRKLCIQKAHKYVHTQDAGRSVWCVLLDDSCDDTLGHSEREGHICSLDSRRSWLPRDGETVAESWGRSCTPQQAPWMVSSLPAVLPLNPGSRCRWMGIFM